MQAMLYRPSSGKPCSKRGLRHCKDVLRAILILRNIADMLC
jgi:hypothetical protein